jgi:hypothetical protein
LDSPSRIFIEQAGGSSLPAGLTPEKRRQPGKKLL